MRIQSLLLFVSTILLVSCSDQTPGVDSCGENPGNGKLFVFIGEKIYVKELRDEEGGMDAKFLAKYKILERVCGNYSGNTIEFIVYDHYGRPSFEDYKTVMLYVSEHEGKYYHEKYQFDPLYKTKDGRWAGPYNWLDYDRADTSNPIKPVVIDFKGEVSYSVAGWKKRDIQRWYPTPFYKIVDTNAIAVYGNYVPELFELKKRGVLTARGLYGKQEAVHILPAPLVDVEIPEEYDFPKADRKALLRTWQELLHAMTTNDASKIKALSLDNVICAVCEGFVSPDFYNDMEPIDSFIAAGNRNLPNTKLWKHMNEGRYIMGAMKYPDRKPNLYQLSDEENLVIYEITFPVDEDTGEAIYQFYHEFQFVKTASGFKFYGMESNHHATLPRNTSFKKW